VNLVRVNARRARTPNGMRALGPLQGPAASCEWRGAGGVFQLETPTASLASAASWVCAALATFARFLWVSS
jgi:hypothetical protein